MLKLKEILGKKTELLCKGVNLDDRFIEIYRSEGIPFEEGRKGGAGPLGGQYFEFDDNKTIVNVPLWHNSKETNFVLKNEKDGYFEIFDKSKNSIFANLKLVPYPNYYNRSTTDGILMKKIALVHGIDCLATTIYQRCCYWENGSKCKFCGIELSLARGDTIEEKTSKQLIEVINAAKREGKFKHLLLTTGTTSSIDKGVLKYINILKESKKEFPDIPIHVQIEAVENLEYISMLKEAGADTIGIHIEILDDSIRKVICPGKSRTSYEVYEKNWIHALEIFGKNQVDSFILIGFGESTEEFSNKLEKIIRLGVIPFITPVRPIPQSKFKVPICNPLMVLTIFKHTAKLMKKFNVNPLKNKAGCVRCGACSAITEAYRLISGN